MGLKKFIPIVLVLAFAFVGFLIHDILMLPMGKAHIVAEFHHQLKVVYGFFALCSVVILGILIAIRQKSIDNVGQVFMLLTCIKMGIAYAFIYPVLQEDDPVSHFEKMNFFTVFALFLTAETILTIRVLNKN